MTAPPPDTDPQRTWICAGYFAECHPSRTPACSTLPLPPPPSPHLPTPTPAYVSLEHGGGGIGGLGFRAKHRQRGGKSRGRWRYFPRATRPAAPSLAGNGGLLGRLAGCPAGVLAWGRFRSCPALAWTLRVQADRRSVTTAGSKWAVLVWACGCCASAKPALITKTRRGRACPDYALRSLRSLRHNRPLLHPANAHSFA